MTTYNTRTLINLAEEVDVVTDKYTHRNVVTIERPHKGQRMWLLQPHHEASLEDSWWIPHQEAALADTGMVAVKDDKGEIILLRFQKALPMTASDFDRLIEQPMENTGHG